MNIGTVFGRGANQPATRPARGKRGNRWRASACALAAGVLAAACGTGEAGDDDQGAKIVALWEIKGESPDAIDDYNNAAKLAIEDINAAGGVLGKPVELERFTSSPLDPQQARSSFLKARDADPSAIVGFPSGDVVEAMTRDINAAEIPLMHVNTNKNLAYGQRAGSEWMFTTQLWDQGTARNALALAERNGWEDVATLGTDESFGRNGVEQTKAEFENSPIDEGPTRFVPPDATDLTEPVLAFKDHDAVLSWTFPNILGAQLKQMTQNGIDTPVISGASTPIAVHSGLVEGKGLEQLYAVLGCHPADDERPHVQEFVRTHEDRFDTPPESKGAATYDAVWLMAEAMKKAGTTTDHEKIKSELETLTWTKGICTQEYKADGSHFMSHQQVAIDYSSDGEAEIVETFQVPELDKGGF